jgi:intracellular multiplication protein IcmD
MKILFLIKKISFCIGLILGMSIFVEGVAYAEIPSLGSVAQNISYAISGIGQFFMTLFYGISFGFGLGALIKYKAHRDSPASVTISIPITLLLLSIAFLLLGLLLQFSPPGMLKIKNAPVGGLSGTTSI